MYRAVFESFGSRCVAALWVGDALSAADSAFFALLLDAREASGLRLLGRMAGPDPCSDTVSGRCGHMPRSVALTDG